MMLARILSLIIGYGCGCVLTAEIVTRRLTGRPCKELGHNYPFWQRFRGGKGVATSCAGYFLCNPATGLLSMIIGMLVVFATGYLGLGAVVIASAFVPFSFIFDGTEAGIIAVCFLILMLIKHLPSVCGIFNGTAEKVAVPGAIKNKWRQRRESKKTHCRR